MKKTLSVILSLVLVVTMFASMTVSSFAANIVSGDYEYTLDESGNAIIQKYNGTATELVIASELDGHPVTTIEKYAFRYNNTLEKVTFPTSITEVKMYAFYKHPKLQEIIIPDTLTTIGNYAFYGLNALIRVYCEPGSPAAEYPWGSNVEVLDIALLAVPKVAYSSSQIKMKPTSETTVADEFQLRVVSVITDEDWDAYFANTGSASATSNTITELGVVAAASDTFDYDTAKTVANGAQVAGYSVKGTDYIQKSGASTNAFFGTIFKMSHSQQTNDIKFICYVKYLDSNENSAIIFYEAVATAAVASNYSNYVAQYLATYPYNG